MAVVATVYLLVVRAGPLSLPYFWDEADVYVAGARWLAEHDMDPTPGHFPDDWSRGHPPLLYVLASIAFRLFGPGPFVGHALMVPFAVLGLVATYALGLERHGRPVAIAATGMLATTPLYLTMGAFLLPEMPLTALTAAALWALHRKNVLATALLGVAMVWIKETGIFTSGAIGVALLVEQWRTGTSRERASLRDLALATLPLWALVGFFVWQRVNAGYFVFPHHQGLLAERQFEAASLFTAVPSLFLWHGRVALTAAACLALVALTSRDRRATAGAPRVPVVGTVEVASLTLALLNVVFFAQMFWLERYALPAHPGLIVTAAALVTHGVSTFSQRPRLAALALPVMGVAVSAAGLVGAYRGAPDEAPELTFDYADVMRSHASVAARLGLEREQLGDPLVVAVWPLTVELRDPVLGFTETPYRTLHVDHLDDHPDQRPDVVVIDAGSRNRDRLRALADELGLVTRFIVEEGNAPALDVRTRR
ncbi:MAG: glycosyltransferase family 39 protein [Deltaproteobacteria bacterium]|nr:glycosyltransferase family 39 protein [Deltaproteobacteria bacterium]